MCIRAAPQLWPPNRLFSWQVSWTALERQLAVHPMSTSTAAAAAASCLRAPYRRKTHARAGISEPPWPLLQLCYIHVGQQLVPLVQGGSQAAHRARAQLHDLHQHAFGQSLQPSCGRELLCLHPTCTSTNASCPALNRIWMPRASCKGVNASEAVEDDATLATFCAPLPVINDALEVPRCKLHTSRREARHLVASRRIQPGGQRAHTGLRVVEVHMARVQKTRHVILCCQLEGAANVIGPELPLGAGVHEVEQQHNLARFLFKSQRVAIRFGSSGLDAALKIGKHVPAQVVHVGSVVCVPHRVGLT
jgi:hypothetical protein